MVIDHRNRHCDRQKASLNGYHLFIYLIIYFKLTNLQKYSTYIHKNSQTNWLIKVNYPILQKNLVIF